MYGDHYDAWRLMESPEMSQGVERRLLMAVGAVLVVCVATVFAFFEIIPFCNHSRTRSWWVEHQCRRGRYHSPNGWVLGLSTDHDLLVVGQQGVFLEKKRALLCYSACNRDT